MPRRPMRSFLRGLTIDGGGVGTTGIQFNTGGSLTIANCVIRNLSNTAILFAPSTSSSLAISDSVLADSVGGGIFVGPTSTNLTVQSFINRVSVYNISIGVFVDGVSASGGTLDLSIVDSTITNSSLAGVHLQTQISSPVTHVSLLRVTSNKNHVGLEVLGAQSTLRLANSMVSQNDVGWTSTNGSLLFSYGNNFIDANTAGNTAPSSILMK